MTASDSIWKRYCDHRDLDQLRKDVLTSPSYRPPREAEESLLMRAIESGDLAAVRLLISLGGSPSLPHNSGFTCLHQAVDEVSVAKQVPSRDTALAIIAALLDGGADPNVQGTDGTPLHRAAGFGLVEVARMLLAHGADLEARMLVDGELTPLMHAAVMGQPVMVRFLLDAGADRSAISRPSLMQGPATLRELVNAENPPNMQQILDMLGDE